MAKDISPTDDSNNNNSKNNNENNHNNYSINLDSTSGTLNNTNIPTSQ